MFSRRESSSGLEDCLFGKLYKRRWLMLLLFCGTSFCNAYHWIHLSIISDRVLIVWNATIPGSTEVAKQVAVDWLSLVYFVIYLTLIFPAFWLLDRFGLRVINITAAVLNTLGTWLGCCACAIAVDATVSIPSRLQSLAFPLLLVAQTMEGLGQLFILGIPSQLASTWFGDTELNTATALGVLANQMGAALGLALPPLIVRMRNPSERNNTTGGYEKLHQELQYFLYGTAGFTTICAIPVILFFQERPPTPPSFAQSLRLAKMDECTSESNKVSDLSASANIFASNFGSIKKQMKSMWTNTNFVLLLLCYGINIGVVYTWSILLNVILQQYFAPDSHIGWIGFTMITGGVPGSVILGVILDKTKRFKLTTIIICGLSIVWMGTFTGTLLLQSYALTYVTSFLLGFTVTGLVPTGFQFAAELTYPISEGLTSGTLNASAQLFGFLFTLAARQLANQFDILYTNILFTCLLGSGFLIVIFAREDLRRSRIQEQTDSEKFSEGGRSSEL